MQCREAVPISWWCIDSSPENWAAEAADAVENGYTSFKNKPRPWWDIAAQVEAVAEIVPSDFKLGPRSERFLARRRNGYSDSGETRYTPKRGDV